MVEMRTEQIKCILCNKQLNLLMQDGRELYLCSECQAYFCPDCLIAIKNYPICPAAQLLGVQDHAPKLLKLLPPKIITNQTDENKKKQTTVKIIPEKSIKVLDGTTTTKKTKSKK